MSLAQLVYYNILTSLPLIVDEWGKTLTKSNYVTFFPSLCQTHDLGERLTNLLMIHIQLLTGATTFVVFELYWVPIKKKSDHINNETKSNIKCGFYLMLIFQFNEIQGSEKLLYF